MKKGSPPRTPPRKTSRFILREQHDLQEGITMTKVSSAENPNANKRVFGYIEVVFNALYLLTAAILGIYLLARANTLPQTLSGVMALVLAGGDAFHLVPRIMAAVTGSQARFQKALGTGKLVTSITMTAFYVLLWHIGLLLFKPAGTGVYTGILYGLAALRVLLCLFPQNKWLDDAPPVSWGIYRNLPFLIMGVMVAVLFGSHAQSVPALSLLWLAVALSFAFYIPVVLFSNANRKVGMLMLPKTCAYLWILFMFTQLA